MPWGRWGSRYLNAITLSVHTGLLSASVFAINDNSRHDAWVLYAFISMFISLFAWLFNFLRLRAIAEHPTSTIAAAAQGYVECYGKARQLLPLTSPIHGIPCVWFRQWIYAKDSNNIWNLLDYKTSEQNFEIEDATGRCMVDPAGAEIMAAQRYVKTHNDHKYIEEVIHEGKFTYVLGELETITEASAAMQIKQEVGHLLAQWKKSPAQLRQRFDLDRNGEIDAHEWEQARATASHEVIVRKGIMNQQEVHLIRAPKDRRLFLISGVSPHELRTRFKFWVTLHLVFAAAAAIFILALI